MPTIYTAKALTAALAAQGYRMHYSTVLHAICPLLLAVGAASKPGRDFAVGDEALAQLMTYLRLRREYGLAYAKHTPALWRTCRNLGPWLPAEEDDARQD